MPIKRDAATRFLEKNKMRYGGPLTNPSLDSDYKHIDVFSQELPIYYKIEFEIAERIGRKYNLKLIFEDFTPGEGLGKGMEPDYEPVYVYTCKTFDELKKAPVIINKAINELRKELQKISPYALKV